MMKTLLASAALALLAGCAAPGGEYPSLLPRPIEKIGFAEPERPVPEVTPNPALEVRIDELEASLRKAGQTFDASASDAERLARVARGAGAGSDGWIAAQVALSELDSLRSGTSSIVTDIERAAVDRATQGDPAYPPLERLLADAQARNAAEIDRIAAIEAMLAPHNQSLKSSSGLRSTGRIDA